MNKIFKCDCGCEAIEIEANTEIKEYPFLSITMWVMGNFSRPMSLYNRLRWMWRILKTGNPWVDHIMMDANTAVKFKDCVNKAVDELSPITSTPTNAEIQGPTI